MTSPGVLLAALLVITAPAYAQDAPAVAAPDAAAPAEAAPTGDAAPAAPAAEPAAGEPAAEAAAEPGVASDGADTPATDSVEGAPADAAAADAADPLAPTPGERALYDRLLGGDADTEPGSAQAPGAPSLGIEPPSVPIWLWVVGILGGVALLFLRSRSLRALRGPDAIEVLSRSQLGKDGSLAVVEVAEADGEKRRLLVGFGGGAPRLVADLGRPFPDTPEPAPAALVERAADAGPRTARSPAEPAPRAPLATDEPPPRANAASAWARAMRDAGGPAAEPAGTPPARLQHRQDLIQEVLAEREDDDVRGVGG